MRKNERYYLNKSICPKCGYERLGIVLQTPNDYCVTAIKLSCGVSDCGFSIEMRSDLFWSIDNADLRQEINEVVAKICHYSGRDYYEIHQAWLDAGYARHYIATNNELLLKLAWLQPQFKRVEKAYSKKLLKLKS